MRETGMSHYLTMGIFWSLFIGGMALGDDGAAPQPAPAGSAAPRNQAGSGATAELQSWQTEQAKLLAAVKEALERNAKELKTLKEQYTRDMAEQKKKVEEQQNQIASLQQAAQAIQDRQKTQAAAPNALGAQNAQGQDRHQKLDDLQQKQIDLLERQAQLVADELSQQGPAIEKFQGQAATLESRAKQAAQRDRELGDGHDGLLDSIDSQQRNFPWLPAPLKEWFLPSGTNVTPLTVYATASTRYDLYTKARGAGQLSFEEFTPFFLIQLNKRFLLSGELIFTTSGVSLGQGQLDIFINNWLTADIGYFLAPVGFWNERLDPEWINKLPDPPLVMRQVIPDGLVLQGVQLRGAKYLFRSPVKMEYAAFVSNGLGVPSVAGQPGWADQGNVLGTASGVNNSAAYGARIGFWIPMWGVNFGVSEFVNAPYNNSAKAMYGAVQSVWQPYFNYHYGNWDFRFEYGNNYQRTIPFLGNSIDRTGFYTQIAYRDYKSTNKYLQRLEYVFRYSQERFRGINQFGAAENVSSFSSPQDATVDRDQYTIGINYYFYPTTILKFAYEINSELRQSLHDNVFMMQFATNF
jgi:hypothetical protein